MLRKGQHQNNAMSKRTFLIAIAAAAIALADENLPLVFQEDFEHGADRWQPQDAAQ